MLRRTIGAIGGCASAVVFARRLGLVAHLQHLQADRAPSRPRPLDRLADPQADPGAADRGQDPDAVAAALDVARIDQGSFPLPSAGLFPAPRGPVHWYPRPR